VRRLPSRGGLSICVLGAALLALAGETIEARDATSTHAVRGFLAGARMDATRRPVAASGRRIQTAKVAPSCVEPGPGAPEPGAPKPSTSEPHASEPSASESGTSESAASETSADREPCPREDAWTIGAERYREMIALGALDVLADESVTPLAFERRATLAHDAGAIDDALAAKDLEPRWDISADVFATARIQALGAHDLDDFDVRALFRRSEAFGLDTQRFQRISAGLGWRTGAGTTLKLEGGRDRFSSSGSARDERVYVGLELILSL
jgi:hypothetical protein